MTTIYAHKLLHLRKVGRPQRIATNQRWLDHRRVRRFFQGYHPQKMAKSAGGTDGLIEVGDWPAASGYVVVCVHGEPTFAPVVF
jgi:hypothetical protein